MALTEKQKRFVAEYLVDLNATQAAIRAGYSEKNADKIGHELLGKTRVSDAIREAMNERSSRTEITQDMVLLELAAIGFSKATDYVQIQDGIVLLHDTDGMTDAQKAAIASIEDGKYGVKIRLHDKVRALEKIGEHLGMFSGKADHDKDDHDDGFVDALRVEAAEVWQED